MKGDVLSIALAFRRVMKPIIVDVAQVSEGKEWSDRTINAAVIEVSRL